MGVRARFWSAVQGVRELGKMETALPCRWPHLTGSSGHTGSKFQFGHTVGHLTHDALGYSTVQKQLLAEGAGPQGFPSLLMLPQLSFGRTGDGAWGEGPQREWFGG